MEDLVKLCNAYKNHLGDILYTDKLGQEKLIMLNSLITHATPKKILYLLSNPHGPVYKTTLQKNRSSWTWTLIAGFLTAITFPISLPVLIAWSWILRGTPNFLKTDGAILVENLLTRSKTELKRAEEESLVGPDANSTPILDTIATTTGRSLFAFYGRRQRGLSQTSTLLDTMGSASITMEYFDKVISPKLDEEDNLQIKKELQRSMNLGFEPNIVKNALTWADNRNEDFSHCLHNGTENYDTFFWRIADICCISLNDNYWIQYQRVSKNSYMHLKKSPCDKHVGINFYIINLFNWLFSGGLFYTDPSIKYFDKFISTKLLDNDCLILRKGLQRLINLGFESYYLKNALVWARYRHDNVGTFYQTHPENSMDFFTRVADTCGIELLPPIPVMSRPYLFSDNSSGCMPQISQSVSSNTDHDFDGFLSRKKPRQDQLLRDVYQEEEELNIDLLEPMQAEGYRLRKI